MSRSGVDSLVISCWATVGITLTVNERIKSIKTRIPFQGCRRFTAKSYALVSHSRHKRLPDFEFFESGRSYFSD